MTHPASILSLTQEIDALLARNDLDAALRRIHDMVERIITEPLCMAQVLGSHTLDALCQTIGQHSLATLAAPTPATDSGTPLILYLVTRLQRSGGHTRVIAEFIRARPEARHLVLSTELSGRSDADFLPSIVPGADITFTTAPAGNLQQKLHWLQQQLLALQPLKTYLFNHHQDSVIAAAVQPGMPLNAAFYHHGDHHLSLGVTLPHLAHIDIHPTGYHHCRHVLGLENHYLPLAVADKGARAPVPFKASGTLITATAGRSNKIEVPYFVRYTAMVPEILHATGGMHLHIGKLSPWALRRIRRGLKRRGIAPERFMYLPWVASVWSSLQEHQVDLYIASFPYGGALTMVEAMGAGIPVALHDHIFSAVVSCADFAYTGAFRWQKPQQLLDYCIRLTPEMLAIQSADARAHYLAFHQPEIIAHVLACGGNGITTIPAPAPYHPQPDEHAAWMASQFTFTRIALRTGYRLARRLRRWIG